MKKAENKRVENIAEGVTIDRRGVVHVDESLEQPLCDLAIALQEGGLAVDVQHVLAALVMATRDGKIARELTLHDIGENHAGTLTRYIEVLFRQHGGNVCGDE